MDPKIMAVGLILFWKLAFCFAVRQETCDDTAAILSNPSATCGDRWQYLVLNEGFTEAAAKCKVKDEEPSKCACLFCTSSGNAMPAPSPSSQVQKCINGKFNLNFCSGWCNTLWTGCGTHTLSGTADSNTDNEDYTCSCGGCNGCQTCDDTSAPIIHLSATCGSRWRWLRDNRNYTTAAAKCIVKHEHLVACSCLDCAQSTTTTTTQAVEIIAGFTLMLKVSDVAQFVSEPLVLPVMKAALADLLNISAAWVAVVNVTIESVRRLSPHVQDEHAISQGQFLSSKYRMDLGYAKVSFQIIIPPDGQSFMDVSIIMRKLNRVSLRDATRAVDKILRSGLLGRHYHATVITFGMPLSTAALTQESNVNTACMTPLIVLVSASGFLFLIGCIMLFRVSLKRTRMRRNISSDNNDLAVASIATSSPELILYPPTSVSCRDGELLREVAQAMVYCNNHNASVSITYAIGHRPQDEAGTGPGLFYAAAFTKLLSDNGIDCFSELVMPSGTDRNHVSARMSQSKSSCRVLLVLQTRALYECLDCLKEIYLAQSSNMRILPIRVEHDLPTREEEQWPQIAKDDMEHALMLTAVQNMFGQLNSIPSPPHTVLGQPGVLEDVIVDLKRILHRTQDHEVTHCPISLDTGIVDHSAPTSLGQSEHLASSLLDSHCVAVNVVPEPSDAPGCKQRPASAPELQPCTGTRNRPAKRKRLKERATARAAVGRTATKTSRQPRQQHRHIATLTTAIKTLTPTAAPATILARTTESCATDSAPKAVEDDRFRANTA